MCPVRVRVSKRHWRGVICRGGKILLFGKERSERKKETFAACLFHLLGSRACGGNTAPQYFETEAHALFREVQPAAHGAARVTAPTSETYPCLLGGKYVAVVVVVAVAAISTPLDANRTEACR